MTLLARVGLTGWLVLAGVGHARAEEFHYVLVFGSQCGGIARFSHTFAVFVRAVGTGPCSDSYRVEAHTISWLPESREIRPWALLPEPGQNLDLAGTMEWTRSTGQRVSMWGPYLIDADLFQRAVEQKALLERGCVRYKAIDTGYATDVACNCIHAVSSIVGGYRTRVFSPGYGEVASGYVFRRMEPWVLDCHPHDWVATRLGLSVQR